MRKIPPFHAQNIIALAFILFAFYIFKMVLLKEVKATEPTVISIVNSITNIIMLIVGYYFGKSHKEGPGSSPGSSAGTALMLLAVISLLTGCVSQKTRNRICVSCPVRIETHDSIVYQEVDRMIPYAVPGPTLYLSAPNPCADLCDSLSRLKPGFKRQTRSATGSATIFTRGDSLHVRCEADSLRGVIAAKDKIIKSYSSTREQVPARCDKEHLTKWDSFWIICGRIWAGIVAATAVWLFLRWKLK